VAEGKALRGGGAPPARRENTVSEPGSAERGELEIVSEHVEWENKAARLWIAKVRLPGREQKTAEQFRFGPGEGNVDGVIVVPIDGDDRILLVRQFRHGVRLWMRELPRGSRNEGEGPEECAGRELKEEIGYELTESWPLGRMATDSAQQRSMPFIVAARVKRGEAAKPESTEAIDATYAYTFSELARECAAGTIVDSFTLCAVARLLPHFDGDRFEYRAGVVAKHAIVESR
jgi:ADP-ribose pyrophosphatase